MLNHGLIIDGKERAFLGRKLECVTSHGRFTYTFVPPRELAVRCIYESTQVVSSYTDFELLLEIAFALSNDHGKGQGSTKSCYLHLGTQASFFDSFFPRCSKKIGEGTYTRGPLGNLHTLHYTKITVCLLEGAHSRVMLPM